jgi:hypothetical protein
MLETLKAVMPTAEASVGWKMITVADLDGVQNLLEAIEDAGFDERQVFVLSPSRVVVRWR